MNSKQFIPGILRTLSIIIITSIMFFLVMSFLSEFLEFRVEQNVLVSDASVDLSDIELDSMLPTELNGEWDVFPGLFLDEYEPNALAYPQKVFLPIGKVTENVGQTTYRVLLKINKSYSSIGLYIRNLQCEANIFVNGVLQNNKTTLRSDRNIQLVNAKVFQLNFDQQTDEQEIVISVAKGNETENMLYKRSVIVGSESAIYTHAFFSMASTVFVFGLLVLLALSGCTFMFLHPKHRIITLITLLDTMLAIRVIFGMDDVFDFAQGVLGNFYISNSSRMSIQIFFLMLGGIFGSLLAHYLFDEENKVSKFLTVPLPFLYGIMAVIFPLRLDWFDLFGVQAIMIVFMFTFFVLVLQSYVYWNKNKNAYSIFQIAKTVYVGGIIAVDIFFMSSKINMMLFAYAYMLFLLAHLFIRLYDNNISYKQVAELNQGLEKKVEERTAELTHANKVLSEISISDALTNAYNRLYFERAIELAISSFNPAKDELHLCMFDLDHFKRINDKYGHDVGDEQLKYVVSTIKGMVDNRRVMLARVGGEEFVLLIKAMHTDEVMDTVEGIRLVLEQNAKENENRTTASFGVVRYVAGMTQKEFLKLADQYLYHSKNTGRNKISLAPEKDI